MEIAFELVNDGTEDCGDGADEPQDMDTTVDSDEDGIADNDVDNWFDCYNGDDIAMNLVNDGNEDCSMGEDEHDSEPWMMFDDCTDMSSKLLMEVCGNVSLTWMMMAHLPLKKVWVCGMFVK